MSWFGWLTKGQMNVSMLDSLVLIFELFIVILAVAFVLEVIAKVKKKVKPTTTELLTTTKISRKVKKK
jgi:hypothetical protein